MERVAEKTACDHPGAEKAGCSDFAPRRGRRGFFRKAQLAAGFLGGGCGLICAGCRHVPPVTGKSSFEFERVNPASSPGKGNYTPQLTGTEAKYIYTPASPRGKQATPAYPPAALAAHAGRVKVVLRITIGTDGTVTQVAPALAGLPFSNPFSDQFEAAAEAAVRQWKFEPAEVRRLEPSDYRGTTIWSVTDTEKREMTVEVTFTFTEDGPAMIDRQ
jgi:TonB family protein